MAKIKIHEIAKELFVNSTNVISKLFIGNISKQVYCKV